MTQPISTPAPNTIIAIDLGTTNSLVGVFEEGQVRLIPNTHQRLLTPSAIALDNQDHILIGQAALELRHSGQAVLTSFKRYMGTDRRLTLGKKTYTAPELSALILRSLKEDAEHALGYAVTEAVITVPAYFNDIQRQATVTAAELAGLKVSRLINEPTAAALAYGLGQTEDSCFLVFDLGGGTFDVSIVELFDGVIEVRASTGDNLLGGDDFVQLIAERFWQAHAATLGFHIDRQPSDLTTALLAQAQLALHALTDQAQTTLRFKWQNKQAELLITTDDFNTWIEPLLLRLRRPLERALRDARLRPDEIDQIVMVGGATRIAAVRRLITTLFGRFPLTSIQPDEAIVRGACIQAGLRAKDRALDEVVLTDVCPFTLGIAMTGGIFSPILERNIVIPASRVNSYHTSEVGQSHINLHIFQGENRLVKDNILLGQLSIPLPTHNEHLDIEVRFSYNPNGILEVDVLIPKTGQTYQKVVVNHQSTMSQTDIDAARAQLAALKFHPRDSLPNRTLITKAERLFSETTGPLREAISHHTREFENVLNTQDERKIREGRKQFEEILNQAAQAAVFDTES